MPQIKVPTLVITGSDDKLIPPENSEIMAREIPGANPHGLAATRDDENKSGETPDLFLYRVRIP